MGCRRIAPITWHEDLPYPAGTRYRFTSSPFSSLPTGDRGSAGQLTARFPLRPVAVHQLVQRFDYEQHVPPPAAVPL